MRFFSFCLEGKLYLMPIEMDACSSMHIMASISSLVVLFGFCTFSQFSSSPLFSHFSVLNTKHDIASNTGSLFIHFFGPRCVCFLHSIVGHLYYSASNFPLLPSLYISSSCLKTGSCPVHPGVLVDFPLPWAFQFFPSRTTLGLFVSRLLYNVVS